MYTSGSFGIKLGGICTQNCSNNTEFCQVELGDALEVVPYFAFPGKLGLCLCCHWFRFMAYVLVIRWIAGPIFWWYLISNYYRFSLNLFGQWVCSGYCYVNANCNRLCHWSYCKAVWRAVVIKKKRGENHSNIRCEITAAFSFWSFSCDVSSIQAFASEVLCFTIQVLWMQKPLEATHWAVKKQIKASDGTQHFDFLKCIYASAKFSNQLIWCLSIVAPQILTREWIYFTCIQKAPLLPNPFCGSHPLPWIETLWKTCLYGFY